MNKITTLAIDLAKQTFQLHGVDARGVLVQQRAVRRAQLLPLLAQIPHCEAVMEACATSHYWARQIRALGHDIRLLAPQYVKAFLRGQKNDRNDAQAIACAARQPDMPQVAIKSEEQQAILALHRIRTRLIKERVQLSNQLHGLMGEFGFVMPRGLKSMRCKVNALLDSSALPALLHGALREQLEHLAQIEQRLKQMSDRIETLAKTSEPCQRLMKHRGVGPIISTAFVAEIADPQTFKNGRQVGAWLGLVPRQHSSGGRERLFGITKRGDSYLRKLLIQGAHSQLLRVSRYQDPVSRWSRAVKERRGIHRAAVALANKTARRLWATHREPHHKRRSLIIQRFEQVLVAFKHRTLASAIRHHLSDAGRTLFRGYRPGGDRRPAGRSNTAFQERELFWLCSRPC